VSFQMSSLSTEYLIVPVSARVNGILINPTADAVAFAFKAEGADPGPADWLTGSWAATTPLNNYYQAQILVGPGAGGNILAIGTYVVWLRITDNPEVPVRQPGTITIIP
jgi:hypothetical protein